MKGILKVFAAAGALAVFGIVLMLAGFATGGPSAVRRAMDYTSLGTRHYQGDLPDWLERALGWMDGIDDRMDSFEDGMENWADSFENDMDDWADDVENWAEGYHHAGWGPGGCLY